MTYVGAAFLVFIGGALGALARFLIVGDRPQGHAFPVATLMANTIGALVLGLVVGLADQESLGAAGGLALVGVGFCGALSTFGAFAVQTWTLATHRAFGTLLAYVLVTLGASLAAATAGLWLAG